MNTKYKIIHKINSKGKETKDIDTIVDINTGEVIRPLFKNLMGEQAYRDSGVFPIEPMTAKEYLDDSMLELMLNSPNYIAEEKLDGVRGLLYITPEWGRAFSRNITKENNYYQEFSNHLPHIRDYSFYSHNKDVDITVLDGEFFIPHFTFKEVSSALGSKWDVCIEKQMQTGLIFLNAFDIIYYKGIYLGNMKLIKRKEYLHKYLQEIQCPYIREVPYFSDIIEVDIKTSTEEQWKDIELKCPELFKVINQRNNKGLAELNKLAYYEYITYFGGEGIMLKPKEGKYYQKRGREYTKYKKHISRECVLLYFKEPTMTYEGKDIENWTYWYNSESDKLVEGNFYEDSVFSKVIRPVTKHYFMKWVGKIVCGVLATDEDIKNYEKVNKCKCPVFITPSGEQFIEVVECEGYTEELRADMTNHKINYIGRVVEIEGNEIFNKTGKLRHPRYLRFRDDKTIKDCTWYNHVNQN